MSGSKKPDDWQTAATAGVEQVRTAMTSYVGFIKDNAAKTPWAGTDLMTRMIEFAEQNLAATFDYADQLAKARTFADLAHVQSDFIAKQMQAVSEQTKQLTEAGVKATTDLFSKPKG